MLIQMCIDSELRWNKILVHPLVFQDKALPLASPKVGGASE